MSSDDKPRTEQLLDTSKRRDLFYRSLVNGEAVPTSIIMRMEKGMPLNLIEAAYFTWFAENIFFVQKLVMKYAEIAMKKRDRWSLAPVWERARWDSVLDLGDGEGDFKINDHHRCYLSRFLNEWYDKPFFMTRTVKGEEETYTTWQWGNKFGYDEEKELDVDELCK